MQKKYSTNKRNISFITMFMANSGGLSSKRICGLLGFIISIIIFIAAFILGKEVPEFGDMIIIMSSSLLGISSVENIFQKRVNK